MEKFSEKPIMVRPTLIVGLGGTGALVCQWLEWFIRRTLGKVPPFIRFLMLDTDAMEEGGPPEVYPADFINLFHHMDIGSVVRDSVRFPKSHRHLGWFMPFAKRLDAVFADYGCQGIPRLGRLVFTELREKIIHKEASTRFAELKAVSQSDLKEFTDQFILSTDGAPAVHIACSVCGGTGAGMSIDMAYSLREWAKDSFRRRAEIIGHLVLPEAFAIDPLLQPKLRAVAAATLEQIEFLSDARRSDLAVSYRGTLGTVPFDRLTAPFNFTYLVNGSGDRDKNTQKQLVKMIARAIQAMTLEPTSKLVASESNNKLADALGLYDPANGRRQCFSSYGLRQGTCAHGDSELASWLCSRLRELEDRGSSTVGDVDDLTAIMQESVSPLLNASDRAKELGQEGAFNSVPPDMHNSKDTVGDVLNSVEGYLREQEKSLAKRSSKICVIARDRVVATVTDAIVKVVREDNRPLGCVAAYLKHSISYLKSWSQTERRSGVSSYDAAKEHVKQQIGAALEECARRDLGGVRNLDAETIIEVVKATIAMSWSSLAEAWLREKLREAVEQAIKMLRLQLNTLRSLTHLASDGHTVRDLLQSRAMGNNHELNGFSTTLTQVTPGVGTILDPTVDPTTKLGRAFRQGLIGPIVRHVVLELKELQDGEDHDSRTAEKLRTCLKDLGKSAAHFLNEIDKDNRHGFRQRVSSGQSKDHTYYQSVQEVYELAAPRVNLDVAHKYAEPLGVVIAQHVPDRCVSDLLGQRNIRPADVNEAFESRTGIWLQLLRISYGFCLEALSHYGEYRKAMKEYVSERMKLRPSDMWLDEDWYWDYGLLQRTWSQGNAAPGRGDEAKYEEIKLVHRSICKAAEIIFRFLEEALNDFAATDYRTAMEAARVCVVVRERIMDELRTLTPDDSAAMKTGFGVFTAAVEDLLSALREVLQKMPKARVDAFMGEWKNCRALIESVDAMLSTDPGPQQ